MQVFGLCLPFSEERYTTLLSDLMYVPVFVLVRGLCPLGLGP